jgi:hypothetical protein
LQESDDFRFNPYSLAILCAGVSALGYAFVAHKFLMLFVSAGALWLLVAMALLDRWRAGDVSVPGKKRMFRGIVVALGLVTFISTWYLIVALDPSLR